MGEIEDIVLALRRFFESGDFGDCQKRRLARLKELGVSGEKARVIYDTLKAKSEKKEEKKEGKKGRRELGGTLDDE